jgi:electron transfer flavoprotein alpha subunit
VTVAAIWVHAAVRKDGLVHPSALELLTKARSLGGDVAAVVLGPGAARSAAALGEHGARTVFACDDDAFADHPTEPAVHVLAELAREHSPELILFAPGCQSREIAGRLQALLGTTLVANVDDLVDPDRVRMRVALSVWPGRPGNIRGGVAGTKVVDVTLNGPTPRLVITRARAFEARPSGGRAEIVVVDAAIPDERRRVRLVEMLPDPEPARLRLEGARTVVAGGRGLGQAGNLAMLDELARALAGGAVAVTRPLVDAGWAPFAMQIGQTGATVTPEVYIAVGISGASQHVVGMRGSKRILAVNTDRDAPIFQVADLGIVGDATSIIPAVIAELRGGVVETPAEPAEAGAR